MANVLTLAQQNALAAAAGNPQLLELLESLVNTVGATQQATNTTGKNVPPQAQAVVSYLKGNYIVQITNPGASSPLSAIQSAQATQNANQATTLQPVTAILHQIRYATSPSFGVNDNVQVLGGTTGSTQTYWTLTNLGSGNFYFQIRSSYDGINFNQWSNANGGQSITSFPEQVTTEQQTNSDWAVFTLPGDQLVAVGEGYVPDQGTFTLPENLYSSAMIAIAGPNGYQDVGRHVADIANSDVTIQVPPDTSGTLGIPDYPILVALKYGDQSFPQITWPGNANIFAMAYDPAGSNVTQYPSADGLSFWAVFTLPGGAQLAFGQGITPNAGTIEIPAALNWITFAKMLSVCSPRGNESNNSAHGVYECQLAASGSDIIAQCQYSDGTNMWPGHANWFAIATNLPLQTLTDGSKWLVVNLIGGNQIAFGAGQTPNAGQFELPSGFNSSQSVGIACPGGFTDTGNDMHGVAQCFIDEGAVVGLTYSDGSGNVWSGPANWMVFAWTLAGQTLTPPTPPGVIVYLVPSGVALPTGGEQQFTAVVQNTSNHAVTWAIDGIAGGNSSVGVIDGTGLYTAPTSPGNHTITATSVADPTAIGSGGIHVS
ncbi:MAG TPA: Ig-like domain-containing protein [Acidobacteriaceae bacterium]|jgi:hypothetical protein